MEPVKCPSQSKACEQDLKEVLRMLRPAKTWPRVKRLLLMDPVSFRAASPSLPVAYAHIDDVKNNNDDFRVMMS